MFNETITLLNRYENEEYGDIYVKTILKNIHVQNHITGEDNVKDSVSSNKCRIFIHKDKINKTFVDFKKWINLEDKNGTFTLSRNDYVVLCGISEEITNISSLSDKYDYVYKINSFIYFDSLKSFQVIAVWVTEKSIYMLIYQGLDTT